jgi:MoaA/NifB/PqqE/SkfB family radical SAM enzyme
MNNFCRYLSNGYRFESGGADLTYSPCCWFKRRIKIVDNPNFDQEKEEVSKINDWVNDCSACRQIERSGVYGKQSPRLRSFSVISDDSIPENVPAWVELTIDTTCNAACVICSPQHSTTWTKQQIKFGVKTIHEAPDLVDPLHWLEIIKNKFTLKYIRKVSFLGGEPFESPIPIEFLKLLKTLNNGLSQVGVHFQTNGSLKPNDELLSLMAECARIRFNISLDGVGERFEFMRYPLKWERIENTIDFMKTKNLPQFKFSLLATLTPINAWYYDEIEKWAATRFTPEELGPLKPNRCIGKMDLNATPRELRLAIVRKYGMSHPVSKMFSNLEFRDYKSCIEYLDWLDTKRKTDWRNTFPDVAEYFK